MDLVTTSMPSGSTVSSMVGLEDASCGDVFSFGGASVLSVSRLTIDSVRQKVKETRPVFYSRVDIVCREQLGYS